MKNFKALNKLFISVLFLFSIQGIFADQQSDLLLLQQQIDQKASLQKNNIENINQTVSQRSATYLSGVNQGESSLLAAINSSQLANKPNDEKEPNSGVIILVSLSMPTVALRQILQESQTYRVPVIIRGLVNNNFAQTQRRLYEVLHPDNQPVIDSGVEINPRYFKQFQINQVPAFVSYQNFMSCQNSAFCVAPSFDVVYGNIPLGKALTVLSQNGKAAPLNAKKILDQVGDNHEIA